VSGEPADRKCRRLQTATLSMYPSLRRTYFVCFVTITNKERAASLQFRRRFDRHLSLRQVPIDDFRPDGTPHTRMRANIITRGIRDRCYHDAVCERCWRGDLDIEDAGAMGALSSRQVQNAAPSTSWSRPAKWVRRCRALAAEPEELGAFGVPTFVAHESGELFACADPPLVMDPRSGLPSLSSGRPEAGPLAHLARDDGI
jgi:hypothetical protein